MAGPGGDHLSGTAVAGGLERLCTGAERESGQPVSPPWFRGLAPSRGLPSRHLSMPLVRSYRTLAPLPVRGATPQAIGGVFLWHCPHGHPHWALPSEPGRWGARTFLNRTGRRSEDRPPSDRDHLACFPSDHRPRCPWRPARLHQRPEGAGIKKLPHRGSCMPEANWREFRLRA